MPRTLPDIKIIVASRLYLSKMRTSLATWITVDEPGLVEMYEVLILSAASRCAVRKYKQINRCSSMANPLHELPPIQTMSTSMSLYHFHFMRKSLIDRAGPGVYLSSKCRKTPLELALSE